MTAEEIEAELAQMRKHCKYGIAFLLCVAYWLGVLMII